MTALNAAAYSRKFLFGGDNPRRNNFQVPVKNQAMSSEESTAFFVATQNFYHDSKKPLAADFFGEGKIFIGRSLFRDSFERRCLSSHAALGGKTFD